MVRVIEEKNMWLLDARLFGLWFHFGWVQYEHTKRLWTLSLQTKAIGEGLWTGGWRRSWVRG